MNMYSFRDVIKDDFERISSFPQNEKEVFYMFPGGEYPLPATKLAARAEERWKPTVVLDGDQVAGYSNMYGFESGKHAWLGNFIISPDYRGKGAASALLGEMIRRAGGELGVPKLFLVCHNTNLNALLLYHKTGFIPFELRPSQLASGERVVGICMEISTGRILS